MFKNLFSNDELKHDLEAAEGKIKVLEYRIEIKLKHVESLKSENTKLKASNEILKEKIEKLKSIPNQFGKITRATNRNMNILRELKNDGLSYADIARKMSEYTKENWSKSTVYHLLKNDVVKTVD